MTLLSVNVNKLATIRNSRGKNNPDVVAWAKEIENLGADGITVHPRPDGRHIRFSDVHALKSVVRGELNVEGYPDEQWLQLVLDVKPHQATLVPDPPDALTSNAGWKVAENKSLLADVAARLCLQGIRVSVFIDPFDFSAADVKTLGQIGVSRIELYTERFVEACESPDSQEKAEVFSRYRQAADLALGEGLGLNAGHDLSLDNLAYLISKIPEIDEVSIGHALICDALKYGMAETVRKYREILLKP